MSNTKPESVEKTEQEKALDDLGDMEFTTVYEGLGETWDWNIKPVLVGTYMRSESVKQLKYGSKTEFEDRMVYTFKSTAGDLVAVWGSVNINRAFTDVAIGSKVRLTYQGKSVIGDAGKEVKDFVLEVARAK